MVDDHSDTPVRKHLEDIQDERMTVLRHEKNKNGSAARNTGIEASSGEYIALLDDDDTWKPEKLELQIEKLEGKGEDYKACYTGAETIYSDHKAQITPEKEGDITKEVLEMNVNGSFGSTLLVESETVDEVDGFDEEFDMHQDWEFLLRVLEHTQICCVGKPLISREVMYGYEPRDLDFLLENKERFLSKFEDKIKQLGYLESRKIKSKHYIKISQNAAFKGKLSPGLRYFLRSITYYPLLSFRELARPPYYYLKFLKTSISYGK